MPLTHPEIFSRRHIGPSDADVQEMLTTVGAASLDQLIDQTVPRSIRFGRALDLPAARSEREMLDELRTIGGKNRVLRSWLGMGYSGTITPPVILRNVLENPGWYTAYTPYQAEIAQGRLEALLNYQTMVSDLTGLPVSNASLLDEGTAAAEAMSMLLHAPGMQGRTQFFVSSDCHPQTIDVVRTRAEPLGVEVVVGDVRTFEIGPGVFGALIQYPATDGAVVDPRRFIEKVHAAGAHVVMAADILSLALLTPPGELGADVAVGSTQRFGVPMGYGGPHAAYFATKQDFVRLMPGRIIGVSLDSRGKRALRMALQTREQHIRREKATSNICTAQVLLAVISGMYAAYHGPEGLRRIARYVHDLTRGLARGLARAGHAPKHAHFFDTLRVETDRADEVMQKALAMGINLRRLDARSIGIALDETATPRDVSDILSCFGAGALEEPGEGSAIPAELTRSSAYLTHPVFNLHHSETEMLRYLHSLEMKDLSLNHSMIPLGSCTMKLNATAEMIPVTWREFGALHPFAPLDQAAGYQQIVHELERYLSEITGFAATSLQPNAGSQGEYAGLLVIRAWQKARGQGHRDVCLIPQSAHGTNPASAVLAGMKVVVVKTDASGNVDLADLKAKAEAHEDSLAALMVTYPSTHGVFEEEIREICKVVHDHGGQVYMDGANMNAQVGLSRPGDFGADVCHLNLHKTFCIPHGGGGPGMGPICVAAHLAPHLPSHPVVSTGKQGIGAVSAAPWGSASILLISWMYIRMMGPDGLTHATKTAILNANYVAERLEEHFPVLYRGAQKRIAHECILDLRAFKKAGIEVEDVAKRLMDYGFHAPTVSFPVSGTLMIEPTESEPKPELDRFCEAMISIRKEIADVESGALPREDNPLVNAPHTADMVTGDEWGHAYSRSRAAFPAPWVRAGKFWPSVSRVNGVLGDRNLICSCPPLEAYEGEEVQARVA